jgi:GNAT superfamily N-acetyltransferase
MTPSLEQIRRTLDAELAYTISRLQVLERIPGNPVGVAFRRIDDGAVALMARHLPVPDFNSVVGLSSGHERQIEALAGWYRDNDVKGRFQVVPGLCEEGVARELARAGYFQSGFHVSLIGDPDLPAPAPSGGIVVEPVTTPALLEDCLDAFAAGWGIPEKEGFKANVRPWLHQPGWSLYVASVDGRPAAAATLYVRDGVGYCADAATDPAFRGRGLHTALLRRRHQDARTAGVDFVCSGAAFLSPSHRNMERIGMRTQFIRAIWTPL